jgi:hypothetical protein
MLRDKVNLVKQIKTHTTLALNEFNSIVWLRDLFKQTSRFLMIISKVIIASVQFHIHILIWHNYSWIYADLDIPHADIFVYECKVHLPFSVF